MYVMLYIAECFVLPFTPFLMFLCPSVYAAQGPTVGVGMMTDQAQPALAFTYKAQPVQVMLYGGQHSVTEYTSTGETNESLSYQVLFLGATVDFLLRDDEKTSYFTGLHYRNQLPYGSVRKRIMVGLTASIEHMLTGNLGLRGRLDIVEHQRAFTYDTSRAVDFRSASDWHWLSSGSFGLIRYF